MRFRYKEQPVMLFMEIIFYRGTDKLLAFVSGVFAWGTAL